MLSTVVLSNENQTCRGWEAPTSTGGGGCHFTTLIVTRDDVNEYMKYHAEYTKANRFKDIVCKIYI